LKPEFDNGNGRARCPDCNGAITTFEYKVGGSELGSLVRNWPHYFKGGEFTRIIYHMMRCAGCGRAGTAAIHADDRYLDGAPGEFWPLTINMLDVPSGVPGEILAEFREAELCAPVGAWRAASSMLRSTLEKTLLANGYSKGKLQEKINGAQADGTITAARSKRAHENIRVLGNDVLHDDWRQVTAEEFEEAHHYAQRILEDFYDDRPSVEALLIEKGRIERP
jgi:hypothetical protein